MAQIFAQMGMTNQGLMPGLMWQTPMSSQAAMQGQMPLQGQMPMQGPMGQSPTQQVPGLTQTQQVPGLMQTQQVPGLMQTQQAPGLMQQVPWQTQQVPWQSQTQQVPWQSQTQQVPWQQVPWPSQTQQVPGQSQMQQVPEQSLMQKPQCQKRGLKLANSIWWVGLGVLPYTCLAGFEGLFLFQVHLFSSCADGSQTDTWPISTEHSCLSAVFWTVIGALSARHSVFTVPTAVWQMCQSFLCLGHSPTPSVKSDSFWQKQCPGVVKTSLMQLPNCFGARLSRKGFCYTVVMKVRVRHCKQVHSGSLAAMSNCNIFVKWNF